MRPILGGGGPRVWTAEDKIVCDGNSLTNGHGTGTPYPTQLAALAPLNGLVTVVNTGISGQTTQAMIDNASDVEAAYDATKRSNTLICMEGVNQIFGGSTAIQAADLMGPVYIGARLAAQPTRKIVLLTCSPFQISGGSDADNAAINAIVDDYNDILRTNWRAYGASALVDIRQDGSPWSRANFSTYSDAEFEASVLAGWWAAAESNHIHFSTAGYGAIAQMVSFALRRLRR